jgi:hypothetical protein
MPLSREEIAWGYRMLLGREPEGEKAYESAEAFGDRATLRAAIMASSEFAEKLRREAPAGLLAELVAGERGGPTSHVADSPAAQPRIVFMHIMKTAGSSVRERLEEVAAGAPVWRVNEAGRPHKARPADLAAARILMGHMNFADTLMIPGPKRVFTVLRDPVERVVSHYYFLHRHRLEYIAEWRQTHPNSLRDAEIARDQTLEEFLGNRDSKVRSVVTNHMTRALAGDYHVAGNDLYRRAGDPKDRTIDGRQLLLIALRNLFALDFVTFTQRLEQDRPKLMAALGVPDPGPFSQVNTRDLVSPVLEKRPPPVITPLAEKLLRRVTDLDRQLYWIAQQNFR